MLHTLLLFFLIFSYLCVIFPFAFQVSNPYKEWQKVWCDDQHHCQEQRLREDTPWLKNFARQSWGAILGDMKPFSGMEGDEMSTSWWFETIWKTLVKIWESSPSRGDLSAGWTKAGSGVEYV